mgnify:CR=1 FL=1
MDKTVFPNVSQDFDTKHFARQLKQMADDFKVVFDSTQTSDKPLHYVDESNPLKNAFVDVSYIKDCIETLPNEELEQVIAHCNMLIERNTVEMGGV